MVYKNNFVATIKVNGKILREHDGIVTLPFGSEYSILLKNLESRRASVNIQIDGEDISNIGNLMMEPNSTKEIERFIGSDVQSGNRFKFIQKTKEIQDYRGDKVDDGLVRIEYRFERRHYSEPIIVKEPVYVPYWPWEYCYPYWPWYPHYPYPVQPYKITWTAGSGNSSTITDSIGNATYSWDHIDMSDNVMLNNINCTLTNSVPLACPDNSPLPEEGITVKGSKSDQKFSVISGFQLEENSCIIVLSLRGTQSNGTQVSKPVTVDTVLKCTTCGRTSKSNAKFCANCGTFLT